jgi:hypothetical protein
MAEQRTVNWYELDKAFGGLETDLEHEIRVQREAIPLIFVPGIMGSRLKRTGTDPNGKTGKLPNMRWEPGKDGWMLKHYGGGKGPLYRKDMLVGPSFKEDFLEVDNSNPVGDGFQGIGLDYLPFLEKLKTHDWGALHKIFEFPVYAVGYNWTDDCLTSGGKLAKRIEEIKAEARKITGLCEKVILITHSLGGIVARAARELCGAQSSILGVIHGVQPVTGAPAAYWRMKAGFEGNGLIEKIGSWVLGNSGPNVTVILANIPGGLQLLPTKWHQTLKEAREWLTFTGPGAPSSLPKSNPYEEIYRVPAVVGSTKYWGLVDPVLIDPGAAASVPAGRTDSKDNNTTDVCQAPVNSWGQYLRILKLAEVFHDKLGKNTQPNTFCFRGTGETTVDTVEFHIESNWVRSHPYPVRGFRGFFKDAAGKDMQAVLQDADKQKKPTNGDGTVPESSAKALDSEGKNQTFKVKHKEAFEKDRSDSEKEYSLAQLFAVKSIIALCKERYDERRKK